MIKRYYNIFKDYFKLGIDSKKYLILLFITSFLRSTTVLTLPYFASRIVKFATIHDYKTTFINLVYLVICFIIYNIAYHYNFVMYAKSSTFTHKKLQQKLFKKVSTFDENFSKDISTSFLINTAFNDVGKVQQVPDLIFEVINNILSVLISIVILFSVNIYVGLFSLILSIVSLYLVSYNLKNRDYYLNLQRKEQDRIVDLIGQVMDGNKEIKSFDMSDGINGYLDIYSKFWKKAYFTKRHFQDRVFVTIPMMLGIGKVMIYSLILFLILNGQYEVSIFILVIGYYGEIESKNRILYNKLELMSSFYVRIKRISSILNYKTNNMIEFGKNMLDDIYGNISFENVTFFYENVKTLDNVSFDIKSNSFTAIVGKSGSGKSTIFRLLLRLYKTTKGKIYIDGTNIYDYSSDIYSSNVSIVTQKPFIFDMSIRDNLGLVDPNIDNQIEACKRVGIHDFIMSLPKGYNTKLTRDASNISIGQKQLIALARTLLSKSEILLFDEVTSSLDLNTSKHIMKILKDLRVDHTILMITHKPQLMKMADDILVIHKGRIVGRGKHRILIENNSYYRSLQK